MPASSFRQTSGPDGVGFRGSEPVVRVVGKLGNLVRRASPGFGKELLPAECAAGGSRAPRRHRRRLPRYSNILHRSALLRQHRLRRFVRFLLYLAPTRIEIGLFRAVPARVDVEERRTSGDPLSPRQQEGRGAILHGGRGQGARQHASLRRRRIPRRHILRLQTIGGRGGRSDVAGLADVSARRFRRRLRHRRDVADTHRKREQNGRSGRERPHVIHRPRLPQACAGRGGGDAARIHGPAAGRTAGGAAAYPRRRRRAGRWTWRRPLSAPEWEYSPPSPACWSPTTRP